MTQTIHLEDLESHLKTIDSSSWEKLLQLIPKIEKSNSFGEMKTNDKTAEDEMNFPYYVPSVVVEEFYDIVYELEIVVDFNWMEWKAGKELLNNKTTDYTELSIVTLCKLITVFIRADRFNEGFLVACFENGTVSGILKGIKKYLTNNNLQATGSIIPEN